MQDLPSDALVIFGITGDLAYKKIIPAVYGLIARGRFDGPILGVAREGWTKERLVERFAASLREHGGNHKDESIAPLADRFYYVGGHRHASIERGHGFDRLAGRTAFRQGLISNLANPKMAVFFASILPQFAPRDGEVFGALLLLGLLLCAMTFAWLTLYAVVLSRIQETLIKPWVKRLIEGITGAALIVLGLRLVTVER